MNKNLVGKWYQEESGETVNIFDEMPLRMKLSFASSGHYNFEPNCVYEDGDDLCFELNDDHYRAVYHVHCEEGRLCGYYTQLGEQHSVAYQKLSDIPEDSEYEYLPKIYVEETDKPRLCILREYADYLPSGHLVPESIYELNGQVPEILKKYGFDAYFTGLPAGSDAAAFAALDFVCDHFGHDGSGGMGKHGSIRGQIEFCEAHGGKVNCRGLAILLSSILRSKGIKARHITCMPYEQPFRDCHVVVDCLLPSGSRIMLDPTFHLYYTDKDGKYVSLRRLREMLIHGEALFHNQKAAYNQGAFDAEGYREYMTKNTFRFSRGRTFSDGIDESWIDLIPQKYIGKQMEDWTFTTDDADFWKM